MQADLTLPSYVDDDDGGGGGWEKCLQGRNMTVR